MNKFEEVPTEGHQIPLAGSRIAGRVGPGGVSHAEVGGDGGLYSEAQCIMGNGHMLTPM